MVAKRAPLSFDLPPNPSQLPVDQTQPLPQPVPQAAAKASVQVTRPVDPLLVDDAPVVAVPSRRSRRLAAGSPPPSRKGKRAATCYLDSPEWFKLRTLALRLDTTVQDLMAAAVMDVVDRPLDDVAVLLDRRAALRD